MSRWLAGMLAGAALAPLALPAHAVAETFTTTGSITFTWHGDPARGCAAEGLCAVQGELTLAAQGSVSVESFGANPRRVDAPLETSGSTARVLDGAGAGECVDVVSGPGGENDLRISRGAGGRLVGRSSVAMGCAVDPRGAATRSSCSSRAHGDRAVPRSRWQSRPTRACSGPTAPGRPTPTCSRAGVWPRRQFGSGNSWRVTA
jgi:hypothetical protein